MIRYVTPKGWETGIREYLDSIGQSLVPRMAVLHYDEVFHASSLPSGTYVWSALDQLDSAGRRLLADVCEQLSAGGAAVRFLNSPRATLRRVDLLNSLHRHGINRHRAVCATGPFDDLSYPVFIREEHGHEGNLSPLLRNAAEVVAELGVLLAKGFHLEDLRVLEYYDTADPEGYYRTYGAFVVGSEVIPQFLSYGKRWMLKQSGTEFGAVMLREEFEYVTGNPHRDALRRIFALANVGYGRIDYSVKGGAIEVWEINLNPTIGWHYDSASDGVPDALRPAREGTRQHFARMFQAAFEAVDQPGETSMIPIHLDRSRRASWGVQQGSGARNARMALLRRLLRPIKPLVIRLARAVAPMVVWIQRPGKKAAG